MSSQPASARVTCKRFSEGFRKFVEDETGVTAIEYGLIAALIALTILILINDAGSALNLIYTKIANCLINAAGC